MVPDSLVSGGFFLPEVEESKRAKAIVDGHQDYVFVEEISENVECKESSVKGTNVEHVLGNVTDMRKLREVFVIRLV